MNKLLLSFTALLLVLNLGLSAYATSTTFDDVPSDAWYIDSVERMADLGLIDDPTEAASLFKPSETVNRAQLVTVMDRMTRYNVAYNLSLAFLNWSMNQEKPQEIYIEGDFILLSSERERSDGEWGVYVTDFTVGTLSELMPSDITDDDLSACFASLSDYGDTELETCSYVLGDIEMEDAHGFGEY